MLKEFDWFCYLKKKKKKKKTSLNTNASQTDNATHRPKFMKGCQKGMTHEPTTGHLTYVSIYKFNINTMLMVNGC